MKLRVAVVLLAAFCVTCFATTRRITHGLTSDWARRVVQNGGAMPSQPTIQCMETLRLSLIAQGITNKIYSLAIFVPDSVIAAATPLFKHHGFDPWTNTFVIGDLSVNGLKGNGTTKLMDTGVKPKDVIPTTDNFGVTVIVTESAEAAGNTLIGFREADDAPAYQLETSTLNPGQCTLFVNGTLNGGSFIQTNEFARVGYVSANRDSNQIVSLYVASPLETHKLLSTLNGTTYGNTATEDTFSVFCVRYASTNANFSSQRMSMAAVHNWFTQTESSNFWTAVRTCRECLGGGTGDQIHNYNVQQVAQGGAAISTTSSNALRTFYAGLDTDGTLYSMTSVNAMLPDNLTAARMPVIWQTGSQLWTNFNFGLTNLTVSGLKGDGSTKYLNTGIIPLAGKVTPDSNFGMIVMSPDGGTNGNVYIDFGNLNTGNSASNTFIALNFQATSVLEASGTAAGDFVQVTPSPRFGFYSGQRVTTTDMKFYFAKQGTTHAQIGVTANSATPAPLVATMTAFAGFNTVSNGVTFYTTNTLSFIATSKGLTQNQSSNLYDRVHTLRTSLGGGSP